MDSQVNRWRTPIRESCSRPLVTIFQGMRIVLPAFNPKTDLIDGNMNCKRYDPAIVAANPLEPGLKLSKASWKGAIFSICLDHLIQKFPKVHLFSAYALSKILLYGKYAGILNWRLYGAKASANVLERLSFFCRSKSRGPFIICTQKQELLLPMMLTDRIDYISWEDLFFHH